MFHPQPPSLNDEQRAMLAGEHGRARQMGMRLLLDLAAMAGADHLVPIGSAHLSGVSPLTGGLGLRLFLDSTNASSWGPMFAMASLALAPIFVFFLLFQRLIVEGIATTGIK